MKTTGERPHLQRGLPERGVSPSGWLQTVMAHRLSSPHPSTSHAKASERRSAVLTVSGSSGFAMATHSSQAKFPFPSGHILQGRPIDRSDPGRPTVPPLAAAAGAAVGAEGGVDASRLAANKRSQHPHTRRSSTRQASTIGRPPSRQLQPPLRQSGLLGRPKWAIRFVNLPHPLTAVANPPAAVHRPTP